ncbi:MAG: flagellar motor protein [Chloroflexota bacterium]|nr:flagellar motor protein [Dehalococcoidia bacterium]MDW8254465.1 flagellar motor protein [Chloroflexota bacterium]
MQLTAILGVIIGFFGVIGGNILEGGNPASLIQLPAFVIVVVSSIGITMLATPGANFAAAPKALVKLIRKPDIDPPSLITRITTLAEKARKEGLLSLESEAQSINDDFLKKGIELIVDGTDPEVVGETLRNELYVMEKRHESVYTVFEALGGYAPTMGVLGTVMGLVHVMEMLGSGDIEKLGHGIAVAFIATLYGVGTANLIFLPIGGRLKKLSQEEVLVREMMIEGILSIQAGENPRVIQQKLLGFLAPSARRRAANAEARKEGAVA